MSRPANPPVSGPSVFPLLRLVAGSVCISLSPIFIRLAAVDPDSAGFYRMLFAGLALVLWLRISGRGWRMPRRPWLVLTTAGVFLGTDFMCWHRSIFAVGPGLSTLLGNFQVFFTALFSWLLLGQRVNRKFLGAVLLALAGLLMITGIDPQALSGAYRWGIALGLGTAVFYSGYILLIQKGMSYPAVNGVSAMLMVSIACTIYMGLVTLAGGESFRIAGTSSLLALLGAGVVSTTLGWSLISTALRDTPATLAGLVLLLQPALSFVWEALIFGRPTTPAELVGIVLILLAIYLGSRRSGSGRS